MSRSLVEASNVINGLKCIKGPKYNTDWVVMFGPKCNKPLVLNVINLLLHLGPNIEASNVITAPKCNKGPKCKSGYSSKCNINN